ncbi:hypothetical protein ANCDUO_05196, partial [Ancylostoma duodenale]
IVGCLSCALHVVLDGFVSLPLVIAVFYLLCAHYGCSSRNNFSIAHVREVWRNAKAKYWYIMYISVLLVTIDH